MASGRKGQSSGLKMKFWELLSGSKVPSWWDPCKFFVTYDMLDVLFDHCSKFDGTMDNLLRSSLTLLDFIDNIDIVVVVSSAVYALCMV